MRSSWACQEENKYCLFNASLIDGNVGMPLPLKIDFPSQLTSPRNITWHPSLTHVQRSAFRAQKGFTLWFTGLSGSGKSTIAAALEQHLLYLGLAAYRLDGDNIRFGLNRDLGFGEKDRNENIRRIAEVALLFSDSCTITLASFISPYRSDRIMARKLHEVHSIPFIEIYVHVPLSIAEQRDPKGLYAKARSGEIKEFTGVSAPYEEPDIAEVTVKSSEIGVEDAVRQILKFLEENELLAKGKGAMKTAAGSRMEA